MNKFAELDSDGSGELEGAEILALAEWVWCSFNPDKRCLPQMRKIQAEKIMTACDSNGDGDVDREEFLVYYDHLTESMEEFKVKLSPP